MRTSARLFVGIGGIGFLLLVAGTLRAQDALEGISKHLFPPELVRAAYQALDLTEEQGRAIKEESELARREFADLKERLQAEVVALVALVSQERPDEEAVLTQAERVLEIEHQIKQRHLALLVRIKNVLTSRQQEQLVEIRAEIHAKKTQVK